MLITALDADTALTFAHQESTLENAVLQSKGNAKTTRINPISLIFSFIFFLLQPKHMLPLDRLLF